MCKNSENEIIDMLKNLVKTFKTMHPSGLSLILARPRDELLHW